MSALYRIWRKLFTRLIENRAHFEKKLNSAGRRLEEQFATILDIRDWFNTCKENTVHAYIKSINVVPDKPIKGQSQALKARWEWVILILVFHIDTAKT